jgi:adenylate kinase
MDAKTWKKEVVTFCPGVGKGTVRPASEIRATIEEQQIANQAYVDGN